MLIRYNITDIPRITPVSPAFIKALKSYASLRFLLYASMNVKHEDRKIMGRVPKVNTCLVPKNAYRTCRARNPTTTPASIVYQYGLNNTSKKDIPHFSQ